MLAPRPPPFMSQIEPSIRFVHAVGKPGHDVPKGIFVAQVACDGIQDDLQIRLLDSVFRLAELFFQIVAQEWREPAIFNHEPLVLERIIEEIDVASYRRSPRRSDGARVRIPAQGKEVAVRTPVVSEERAEFRQSLVLIATAQQEFSGPQRAGRDNHFARGLAATHQLSFSKKTAARNDAIKGHAISAIDRLDETHIMKRAHISVVFLGLRNIVQVQSVLGVHLTPEIAVSAVHAGALLHSLIVEVLYAVFVVERIRLVIGKVRVKGDCDRHFGKAVAIAGFFRGFLHQLEAMCKLPVGKGLYIQHFSDAVIIRSQFLVGDFSGPSVVKAFTMGGSGDVGVNERTAAHGGAHHYGHVAPKAPVYPALFALRVVIVVNPVFSALAGVVLHFPSAPALQHQDSHSLFRKTAGGDSPAKSAADNQNIKIRRHTLPLALRGKSKTTKERIQCFLYRHTKPL